MLDFRRGEGVRRLRSPANSLVTFNFKRWLLLFFIVAMEILFKISPSTININNNNESSLIGYTQVILNVCLRSS